MSALKERIAELAQVITNNPEALATAIALVVESELRAAEARGRMAIMERQREQWKLARRAHRSADIFGQRDIVINTQVDTEKENNTASEDVRGQRKVDPRAQQVFDHWKKYHPRTAAEHPSRSVERKILARIREDKITVEQLCKAVDGYHKSPFHTGDNQHKTKHLGLDLVVRDDQYVARGIEYADNATGQGHGSKPARLCSGHAMGLDRVDYTKGCPKCESAKLAPRKETLW